MNVRFRKSSLTNWSALRNAISLPGLGFGRTPCAAPDGPMIDRFGRAHAPANPSAMRDRKKDFKMTGTFGLTGKNSLTSAALQSSLASKLQARSIGSILYRLTWKDRVTPSGRTIFALRASAARTSGSEFILSGFPTPCQQDGPNGGPSQGTDRLPAAAICGWPTTTTRDHKDTGSLDNSMVRADGKIRHDTVPRIAHLAGWSTVLSAPTSKASHGQSSGSYRKAMQEQGPNFNQPMRLCSDGKLLTGYSAGMESGGRLNPAHSRWLMRLPPEWDDCAPMATRSTRKPQSNSVRPSKKSVTKLEYDL